MIVNYAGVDLEIEHVTQWSDRNIYSEDNSERIMRHVVLSVQFVIHPAATTIAALAPRSAAEIAVELKRRLLQPRQPLVVTVGTTEVLRSPAIALKRGMPVRSVRINDRTTEVHYTDARTGPHPISCDVTSILGTKTFVGTFTIETWLVDGDLGNRPLGTPEPQYWSALVSHRWEMSNEFSRDCLNTRTISGRAVFRGDFLYEPDPVRLGLRQIKRKPSDYIGYLNHPLPDNYERVAVRTNVSGDGLSLAYTIVDQERASIISEGKPIAEIQGRWRAGIHLADFLSPGVFAERYMNVSVRVKGRRHATRQDLINACVRVVGTFDKGVAFTDRAFYRTDLEVDIVDKEASLSVGYTLSGVTGWVWALNGTLAPGIEDGITRDFPEDLEGGLGTTLKKAQQGNQPAAGMIGDNIPGTDGGGPQRLTTQRLLDGQLVPGYTPNPSRQLTSEPNEVVAAAAERGETGSYPETYTR